MDHLIEGVGLVIIASSFGLGYGVRALMSVRRKSHARARR
jgi:hypothetical protein